MHKKYPRTDAAIGRGKSAGKFAASQTIKVQHSFQSGNVGVHVQRVGLEQLVQLVFKAVTSRSMLRSMLCLASVMFVPSTACPERLA